MTRDAPLSGGSSGTASRRATVPGPSAGVRSRPRPRRSRLFDLGAVTLAFVTGAALLGLYASYRIWEVGQRDDRRPADAIVVLGAAQYNGTPSAVLAARLDHAIDLYREGLARYFVVTGGKLPGDWTTEAETERRYAVAHGVPSEAILVEDSGRTTLESMQNVRAIFERHGLHSAIFVSDRVHMLRLLTMAADQGITAHGSPTGTSPSDTSPGLRAESLQHELGALALYFLVEQGQTRSREPLRAPAAGPAGDPNAGSTASSGAAASSGATPSRGQEPSSSPAAGGGDIVAEGSSEGGDRRTAASTPEAALSVPGGPPAEPAGIAGHDAIETSAAAGPGDFAASTAAESPSGPIAASAPPSAALEPAQPASVAASEMAPSASPAAAASPGSPASAVPSASPQASPSDPPLTDDTVAASPAPPSE